MSDLTERVPGLGPRGVLASDARQIVRRVLLAAGVLASLLYVIATDVVAAAQWDNYSRTGEMVSKLFAVGSPARPVLICPCWWRLHGADDRVRVGRLDVS
jgi:hypothetical protein